MSNPDEDPAGTAHGSVAGIRSRIAAFENISGGITASNPANGAPIKPTGPSAASNGKSGLRRSAMVPSQSDPLTSLPSHASSDAVPSQALLRATSSQNTLVQGRSNSSSLPSSSAINMSKKAEAVPHVGLGSRASPLLAANMLTSEPASVNLDEPDQLITSPTSVKSLQQHIMLAPTHSPNSSPTSSPARTPSEEKTSPVFGSWSSGQKSAAHLPLRNASTSIAGSSDSTAPPIPISTKPRPSPLPSLSISASPSPKFNFVQTQVYVQPPSPLHSGADTSTRTRTPSLSSGTSKPIPVLPPRKVGSSPSISTNGMGSPQIAGGVRGGARVPSGQDSAPSPASAMPSSMKSSKTQIGHPSSISTNHQSPISVLPSPISGSKPRSTILNAPVLPPRPASTTPTSVTSSGSSGRSNSEQKRPALNFLASRTDLRIQLQGCVVQKIIPSHPNLD